MAERLSRRQLLTAVLAIGAGAVGAQYAKSGGDAEAMLPAGGGGGEDLSGGEGAPSPVDFTFYTAASADELSAADGAVTVVTGGAVAALHFGVKGMTEVDPQGYKADDSNYDASEIDQTPAWVFVPDDGDGIGSIYWEGS